MSGPAAPRAAFRRTGPPYELADLVDAVRRTVLDFWPRNQDAVGDESVWLMDELTRIDMSMESPLYDRYLRLCDRIQATNFAQSADQRNPPLTHGLN